MSKSQRDAHRFFNAMVLMGGSLALGCGGTTADGEAAGGAGAQAGGAGGTQAPTDPKSAPSGGTSGAPSSTGGVAVSGAGGVSTGGAPPAVQTGGAGGAVVDPPVFDVTACQPSQWVCSVRECDYGKPGGVRVPADCHCDPTLPVDVLCGPDEKLACLHGTADANGDDIRSVDFSCRCVPAATGCDACQAIFGGPSRMGCDESRFEAGQIICGCAYVYLR